MKRARLLVLLLPVVVLTGCELWWMVADPLYSNLEGGWDVNLATRPAGWPDTKYVFTSDKKLEIYYDTTLAYKGSVTSVESNTITMADEYNSAGNPLGTMKMCYVLSTNNTVMRLGWYDSSNNPVYYLDLAKE